MPDQTTSSSPTAGGRSDGLGTDMRPGRSRLLRSRPLAAAAVLSLLVVGTGPTLTNTADAAPTAGPAADSALETATHHSTPRRVHVVGLLTPVEGDASRYTVTGDLVGSYRIVAQQVTKTWVAAGVRTQLYEGTEEMKVFLDYDLDQQRDAGEPRGTLQLVFQQLASDDARTGRFISGYCVHPVAGTSGSYRGGTLRMFDDPTGRGAEISTRYDGYLTVR